MDPLLQFQSNSPVSTEIRELIREYQQSLDGNVNTYTIAVKDIKVISSDLAKLYKSMSKDRQRSSRRIRN